MTKKLKPPHVASTQIDEPEQPCDTAEAAKPKKLPEWKLANSRLRPAFLRVIEMSNAHGPDSQQVMDAWAKFEEVSEREKQREHPAAMRMPLSSDDDPRVSEPERTKRHTGDLTGTIYDELIRPCMNNRFGKESTAYQEITSTTVLHARDTLQRVNTTDPMEEMLVGQALMTHARIIRLNHLLADETRIDQIKVLSEAADRASNTYRRQMAALDEHRRPRATPHFNQTNIAGQQIIQNNVDRKEKSTNEQGLADETAQEPAPGRQATLPADAGGATITTAGSEEEPAVAAIHRPQDRRG